LTTDTETQFANLAARLTKLETQSRWLRLTAVIAFALGCAALIIPQLLHSANEVVAGRFAVRNTKHELAAMLTTGRDDLPVIALSSANKVRALIGLRPDGGVYLTLSNAEGKLQWTGFINENGPHVDNRPPK
jgi:hypothetical protein